MTEVIETEEHCVAKTWPPTEEEIMNIACAGLNQSQNKDVSVLVYWDNPSIMILDPLILSHANTEYIKKKYNCNERTINVIIGKED
jgi:hypothetical protein|tara:strand:- start:51 stop:308 length:258 start_codon:yes stop_codon:yes gene_type:complete